MRKEINQNKVRGTERIISLSSGLSSGTVDEFNVKN